MIYPLLLAQFFLSNYSQRKSFFKKEYGKQKLYKLMFLKKTFLLPKILLLSILQIIWKTLYIFLGKYEKSYKILWDYLYFFIFAVKRKCRTKRPWEIWWVKWLNFCVAVNNVWGDKPQFRENFWKLMWLVWLCFVNSRISFMKFSFRKEF